jgi:hypothetical protein
MQLQLKYYFIIKMLYKINFILLFILLYLIFFKYFIIDNLNVSTQNENNFIKITINQNNIITSELENTTNENFNTYLVSQEQQNEFCDRNIGCRFPIFNINGSTVSINNFEKLVDTFYNYILNLDRSQYNSLKNDIGFNLYQFSDGKIIFNNEKYCLLKEGGFNQNRVKRPLPNGESCDIANDSCIEENGRYFILENRIENSFCNYSKNIELVGNLYCKNNLDINFSGKLCLSFDKFLPLLVCHIIDNNYNYKVEINNYRPDNYITFFNKINNLETSEECPLNSSSFNNICKCNSGFKCVGNNCNNNLFSLKSCYNCACINSN